MKATILYYVSIGAFILGWAFVCYVLILFLGMDHELEKEVKPVVEYGLEQALTNEKT